MNFFFLFDNNDGMSILSLCSKFFTINGRNLSVWGLRLCKNIGHVPFNNVPFNFTVMVVVLISCYS